MLIKEVNEIKLNNIIHGDVKLGVSIHVVHQKYNHFVNKNPDSFLDIWKLCNVLFYSLRFIIMTSILMIGIHRGVCYH